MKKEPREDVEENENPSWYHYLIIIGIVVLIFALVWVVFDFVSDFREPDKDAVFDPDETYNYEYVTGNVTYNIQLSAPLDELRRFDFEIEPSKEDILNTVSYTFSFDEYNASDNGHVSVSSIKLRRFLSIVYYYSFDESSFVTTDEVSCDDATRRDKVITFDPRHEKSGVFMDGDGCIVITATQPNLLPFVVDSLIVSILEE